MAETVASITWNREEAGWYTSEIGGVCIEDDGWWFYPSEMMRDGGTNPSGPFATKREAFDVAESRR